MAKKILYVVHGHPDHHPGGGEIAAYNLHRELSENSEYTSAFFARHGKRELLHDGAPFSGNGKPGEVLFYSVMPDHFRFSQPDKSKVWRDFQEMLTTFQPDLVHFHHYLHLGLELFRQVKNHNPQLPIVLSLHEFCGICHNHGQMVKTKENALCKEASPANCSACFPKYTAQDFFLREQFIKSHFSLVDRFISPSHFLAQRYIDWGLPEHKFTVIENILGRSESKNFGSGHYQPENLESVAIQSRKVKLGFFGQINRFKGVDLLLEALEYLPADVLDQIELEINGSGLEKQPGSLRRRLSSAARKHSNVVSLRGAYHRSELDALMSAMDWVIVPSIWWENSPVVILEARKNGVPVLCSDIGGMAEKVESGKTGLHFMARRARSLAQQITWIVENRAKQSEFSAQMQASYDPDRALNAHLVLYKELLRTKQRPDLHHAEGDVAANRLRVA